MSANTIEQTIVTLTIPARDALDLLSGANIIATSKGNIDRLSAVFITSAGGTITAAATDRYRLITGELVAEAPEFATRALSVADIKRVITALKDLKSDIRRHDLTLSIAGDIVSVAINGVSFTLNALDLQFPPYKQLFTGERVATDKISFNPAYMADFGKIPTTNTQLQLVAHFTGDHKPIEITIPHDRIKWSALLMPMKVSE